MVNLAVIGLPSLALLATRVRGGLAVSGFAALGAMSRALILLSRSRGAWLALAAMLLVGLALLAVASGSRPTAGVPGRRRLARPRTSRWRGGCTPLRPHWRL